MWSTDPKPCWFFWTDLISETNRGNTSAEIAKGELVNAACVAIVRSTGEVMELRNHSSLSYQAKSGAREVWILQRS